MCLPVAESFGSEARDQYYSVQIASYRNIDGAAALVNRLKAQGCDPFRRTVEIPGKGTWQRIFVGKYTVREEALRAGEELRKRGILKHFIIAKITPEKKDPAQGRDAQTPGLIKNAQVPAPVEETRGSGLNSGARDVALDKNAQSPASDMDVQEAAQVKDAQDTGNAHGPTVLLRKKISSSAPGSTEETVPVPPHHTGEGTPPHDGMTATGPPAAPSASPDRGLYDSALKDFTAGRYEDALQKFGKGGKAQRNEAALRRMADCHYFLGEKGDKGHLSKAVDRYRDILRTYPGLNEDNVQATYRLAESYRRLGLHYEALVEFKNIYANYPESGYTPESLYMMGALSYETRRFAEAIDLFKEYIQRFPEGSHVRDAYFGVGDCYSQMRQFNDADVWYDNALKKWPTLEDIPEDALRKLGAHHFQTGRYDDALRVLFAYLNLFPDGDRSREALYAIARSFEKTRQMQPALKMFSLVIERYPRSREAAESALIMANIGVDDPGIPVPAYIFAGMDGYKNPIEAYRAMEGSLFDPEMEEEVIFRKGTALIKRKRYREAFEAGRLLLATFPRGVRRDAGEKNLAAAASHLIDEHYAKKDYLSVVDLYFDLDRGNLLKGGNFDMLSQIGKSLKEMRLLDQAAGLFEEMIRVFGEDPRGRRLSLDMAEIDYARGRYGDAKKRLQTLIDKRPGVNAELTAAARNLMGNISYKEGSYPEAAGFYSAVLGSGTVPDGGTAVRKRYADVLREMGMYSAALVNYRRALKECGDSAPQCPVPVALNSYEGLGDCLYRKGNYEEAIRMYQQSLDGIPEGRRSRWTMANIERGYAKLGKGPALGESPASLQVEGGDEFWSRVVDYYRADEDWTERYGPYIQDS